jgi:hypothetical protein
LYHNFLLFAVITAASMLTLDIHSVYVYAPGLLSMIADIAGIIYIVYATTFAFLNSDKRFKKPSGIVAIISIVLLVAALFSIGGFNNGVILLANIYPLLVAYSIALPVIILILLAFYLIRNHSFKHSDIVALALFIFAVALFFIYQVYIFGYKGIGIDDETVIAYRALSAMLAGHNPYLFNSAGIMANNITKYGFTMLTNNTVVGRLDYPALYMLVGLPFYAPFNGSVVNIIDNGNALGYLMMFLLSLFVFGFIVGKKSIGDLKILAPAIFVFIFYSLQIVSPQYSIAIILLLLLLRYIDNKYIFIILGIAASLQELLWVPVLLTLAYISSTRGVKHGARYVLLTLLVFLLINGYFIAMGPGVFVSQVLKPLNGNLLPFYLAPISSLVQGITPIPLGGYGILFYILFALSVIITLYSANKLTIFTGMILSYFALSHSLIIYYLMPIAIMASAFVMDQKLSGKSRFRSWLLDHKISRRSTAITVSISAVLLFVIMIAYFHSIYATGFGVSVYGQMVVRNNNGTFDKVSVYSSTNTSQNAYMLGFYYPNNSQTDEEGLALLQNSKITNSSCTENCSVSGYMNFNIATLHKGLNHVYFYVPKNATSFDCSFYRGKYFYLCPPIYIVK